MQRSFLYRAYTAAGNDIKVIGSIVLNLRIYTHPTQKPVTLKNLTVHLVDCPKWKEMLIGEDVLFGLKLMPYQNISKLEGKTLNIRPSAKMEELKDSSTTKALADAKIGRASILKHKAKCMGVKGFMKRNVKMAPLPKIDTEDFEHILNKTREKLAIPPDAHEPENPHCMCENCLFANDLEHSGECYRSGFITKEDQRKLGYVEDEHIEELIIDRLEKAVKEGCLSSEERDVYEQLLRKYKHVFGTKQSVTRLSNLPPMRVHLKPNATPFVQREIRLDQRRRQALYNKVMDLIRINMLVQIDDPLYGSAVLMIPKKNGTYRMVVDLRQLNTMVLEIALLLPDLIFQMECLPKRIKYMACFDCLAGFDLLRTHIDDIIYFGIITYFGNFAMRGAPMGFRNTPVVYQNRIVTYILGETFCREGSGTLLWLDDIYIYATSFEKFIEVLTIIFRNLEKYYVRLNLQKSVLASNSIVWCGRLISKQGWRFSHDHYNKVLQLPEPQTLAQLEQVVYIINWLSPTIPNAAYLKNHFQSLSNSVRQIHSITDKKIRKSDSELDIVPYWTVLDKELYGLSW